MGMVLDVGSLYAIYAFICAIISAVIFNRTLATKYKQTVDRPFCVLLVFFMAFCMIDCLWGVCTSKFAVSIPLYTFFTNAFHVMSALSAFVWAQYMIRYLNIDKMLRRALSTLFFVLLFFQFGLLIFNAFSGWVFEIDSNCVYQPHAPRQILFWCQFAHYVTLAIFDLILLFTNVKSAERTRIHKTAIIYSSIPLLAGFFQMLFPDGPMYSIGFMISAVTIYSFNVTSQREKELEKRFDEESDKLSSVVSGLSDDYQAIYFVDLDTGAYDVYESSEEYKNNVSSGLVRGNDFFVDLQKNIERMDFEEDRAIMQAQLDKEHIISELKTKKSFSFNYRLLVSGSQKYYLTKVTRSSSGENKIVIGIFDDDERVRAELEQKEELRQAWEGAEQASRAKSKFLFNMSHDIRTPMNAILGYTGMAKKSLSEPEKATDYLDKVTNSGEHLLSLIDDILDMSRIENNKIVVTPEPLSVSALTKQIIDIIAPMAKGRNIALVSASPAVKHDWVYADESCLKRVFINVLTNAVKYNRTGGRITYSVTEYPGMDEENKVFEVIVKDTGIGMSEEFLAHVFDTFSRERSTTVSGIEGTGLGMAITKSLVELVGGSISIASEKDVGTTVTIRLPVRLAPAPDDKEEEAWTESAPVLEGKRVLLVEDNELNAEIAVDVLSDFGLEVETANDGTVAVAKCEDILNGKGFRYDFILMDIQMPKMDGYEATIKIREMDDPYFKTLPIIAMTANVFEEDKKKSREVGMNAHLGKPINIEDLKKALVDMANSQ